MFFCAFFFTQTDSVVCHSCHSHVEARRECTNVASAGTGPADFDSFWCPFQRCLAIMQRSASLSNHVSNAVVIRYNVVSSQVVLQMFLEMNLGDSYDRSLSLNSLDHRPVGLIEAAWRIAGC